MNFEEVAGNLAGGRKFRLGGMESQSWRGSRAGKSDLEGARKSDLEGMKVSF
jgi:hypothetical protein